MRKAKKKGVCFGFEIEFADVLKCFIIIARKQLTRRSSCQGPWSGGDAEDEEVLVFHCSPPTSASWMDLVSGIMIVAIIAVINFVIVITILTGKTLLFHPRSSARFNRKSFSASQVRLILILIITIMVFGLKIDLFEMAVR